ncbi:phosphotransferase family enzyme [Paraburkholderia sp. BL6669N2]|uniref:phosphotransferase n=1 Tax=Paraburkholderia sp. BL6669N2 TaxID=1938807 RepID=UPI000E27C230|nr:phosphotransferase [Paraburkholderia sp. BL6669N2]REG45530.1 phosphotransferase family enzyme [Paraburkholderia sp. BL6669N2]
MKSVKTLQAELRALIEQGTTTGGTRTVRALRMHAGGQSHADQVAENLVQQAIASGLPLSTSVVETDPLKGGNTAELVARVTLHAPFVFKLDRTTEKLAAEGEMMRKVRNNSKLSERFRQAWPVIYAIHDKAPYAYLMEYFPREDGWTSLEDRLYPPVGTPAASTSEATRLTNATLDVLFDGYVQSVQTRALPNIVVDYVGRINERLSKVAAKDARFASRRLRINGDLFEPWQHYVDLLGKHTDFLMKITPQFTTVAHGDPNPGNILMRTGVTGIEVKLIDPKEWETGDYLFDIAKLTHFVQGTGPIEKPASGVAVKADYSEQDGVDELSYQFDPPPFTPSIVDSCLERVQQFASAHKDIHWQARYELAMASNLLGLPPGRLEKGRPDAALILYGEGLRWLKQFCDRLRASHVPAPAPVTADVTLSVEPESLAKARERVRQDTPNVTETTDRRGFQVLHWQPSRANAANKPVELSLEHEARLSASSESILAHIKQQLAASHAMPTGNVLLPGNTRFAHLTVRHQQRDKGSQSVDHYWDLAMADHAAHLIPRMMSMRERVQTSSFMTWTADEKARALNLELPLVAYEHSGVIARLEFNWIDNLDTTFAELREAGASASTDNPLLLAARIMDIREGDPAGWIPLIEHTTYREKYHITDNDSDLFHLNVDHVVAQSLKSGRIATYTDIDVAPAVLVDDGVLDTLVAFSQSLENAYGLVPVRATKAWRDAYLTGELPLGEKK